MLIWCFTQLSLNKKWSKSISWNIKCMSYVWSCLNLIPYQKYISYRAKRALTARRVRIENSDQLHIHLTYFFGVSYRVNNAMFLLYMFLQFLINTVSHFRPSRKQANKKTMTIWILSILKLLIQRTQIYATPNPLT